MKLKDHKTILQVHGISRYSMIEYLTKFKRIPALTIANSEDAFKIYQLHKWSGEYLLESINPDKGTIIRYNEEFIVLYLGGCTRGKVLANQQDQYWISFRKAAPIYGIPYGYAIVSPAPHNEKENTK